MTNGAKNISRIGTVAVHDGRFHSDDVFSVASLYRLNSGLYVVRTRNPDELAKADLRVDVGGKYHPPTGDYDHHQRGGAGERENGVPYASFGLIWEDYGSKVCKSLMGGLEVDEKFLHEIGVDSNVDPKRVAELMDKILVQPIDNYDNNGPPELAGDVTVKPVYIQNVVNAFGDTFHTPNEGNFEDAVRYAGETLRTFGKQAQASILAKDICEKALEDNPHSGFVVLDFDRFIPYQSLGKSDSLYVVQRASGDKYVVLALSDDGGVKKPMPAEWQGLIGEELARETGVDDATFIFKDYSVYASSLNGAIELAKKAVKR